MRQAAKCHVRAVGFCFQLQLNYLITAEDSSSPGIVNLQDLHKSYAPAACLSFPASGEAGKQLTSTNSLHCCAHYCACNCHIFLWSCMKKSAPINSVQWSFKLLRALTRACERLPFHSELNFSLFSVKYIALGKLL